MDFSKISYAQVQGLAEQLNTSSTNMATTLNEIKSLFNQVGTDDVWSGTAASQQKEEFDKLSSRFDEFHQAVKDCSTYLTNLVQRAQELDAKITGQ